MPRHGRRGRPHVQSLDGPGYVSAVGARKEAAWARYRAAVDANRAAKPARPQPTLWRDVLDVLVALLVIPLRWLAAYLVASAFYEGLTLAYQTYLAGLALVRLLAGRAISGLLSAARMVSGRTGRLRRGSRRG